ncbi:MAG: ADP-ribosylation factor-like protein [Candidatus Hodarchaeota archaeon]
MIQIKIIYWGPAEAGKTTSLMRIFDAFPGHRADDLFAVQTTEGRTLWNEYLPLQFDLPTNNGSPLTATVHLSAVTGQERFLNTREFAASSADGVIFVADCRKDYVMATKRSYEELVAFMPKSVPIIVQANFQDMHDSIMVHDLDKLLSKGEPVKRYIKILPTVATSGQNVSTAFLELLLNILQVLF